jgi:biopolymer transport protein TolR
VAAGPLANKDEQLVVTITSDGKIQFNNTALSIEELSQKLTPVFQAQPEHPIRLRADKQVTYGRVAEIMAVVRNAGAKKIGMITEPLKEGR